MFTPDERRQRIEMMRQFPAELEALVKDLSDADLHTPYLAGEWTVAQNVHHVADSHMHAFIRVKLALTEDYPTIKPYNQDAWAETPDARTFPITASLTLIKALHERWCALWDSLSDDQWQRAVKHPESGDVTVEGFLKTYSNHGAAHIDQIRRTLAAKG
ncbi:MAG TPA: putative metal-dependent hydrolase [Spirillospora sp.]|nr:putative metal-dependent hydrolase [Spirillospora sp.]